MKVLIPTCMVLGAFNTLLVILMYTVANGIVPLFLSLYTVSQFCLFFFPNWYQSDWDKYF